MQIFTSMNVHRVRHWKIVEWHAGMVAQNNKIELSARMIVSECIGCYIFVNGKAFLDKTRATPVIKSNNTFTNQFERRRKEKSNDSRNVFFRQRIKACSRTNYIYLSIRIYLCHNIFLHSFSIFLCIRWSRSSFEKVSKLFTFHEVVIHVDKKIESKVHRNGRRAQTK